MIIRFWRPVRVYRNCVAWARQDSNLGPRDYESPALTAELQARINPRFKHSILRRPILKVGGSAKISDCAFRIADLGLLSDSQSTKHH